jgi:hypothetical protein
MTPRHRVRRRSVESKSVAARRDDPGETPSGQLRRVIGPDTILEEATISWRTRQI